MVVLAITACGGGRPAVSTSPPVVDTAAGETYVSSLTGVTFGSAFARATSDGAPVTQNRSSRADQGTTASASAEGDEQKRSCGNQGTRSHAQATAEFQPLTVGGARQFGFALSTTAYAKGGSWRERVVICRGSHNTAAVADASASGRIDLAFMENGTLGEQLILRVSGATLEEAHVEVRDGQNQLLPITRVPGGTWMVATLAKAGAYSVRAWIGSHAAHGTAAGAPAEHGLNVSVSVQSVRDALTLGYTPGAANDVTLPLPVFLGADALTTVLDSVLFTVDHRLFACSVIRCESDLLRDVYVESPRVSTKGESVIVDMHLAGSYQIARVFGGGISGTIRATALPVVERDTLRFESPRIDVASSNTLVRWRAGGFEQKLLDRMRKVRIDLTPLLRSAVARAQQQLSVSRGGACLLLIPREAHVRSVEVVTTAPQGIVAAFDIDLSESTGGACQERRVIRVIH